MCVDIKLNQVQEQHMNCVCHEAIGKLLYFLFYSIYQIVIHSTIIDPIISIS